MKNFTKQITLFVALATCALPADAGEKPKPFSFRTIFTSLMLVGAANAPLSRSRFACFKDFRPVYSPDFCTTAVPICREFGTPMYTLSECDEMMQAWPSKVKYGSNLGKEIKPSIDAKVEPTIARTGTFIVTKPDPTKMPRSTYYDKYF